MCLTVNYPDSTIQAILYVKGTDGKIYPIQPLQDNSAVYDKIYSTLNNLGLKFICNRASEAKPTIADYVPVDASSDYVTNIARYTYKINNETEKNSTIEDAYCKNGEIFIHPNTVLASSVTLPCTVMIGKNLYYYFGNINQGYGYHYAMGAEQTIEITEPGTYHVEKITTGGGIYFGTPPAWYGFSADIVVEQINDSDNYKITATNVTYYTKNAAIKYKDWLNRPTATTLKLDTNGNGTKTIDLTEITDRIEALEQRIAELEALHNNE